MNKGKGINRLGLLVLGLAACLFVIGSAGNLQAGAVEDLLEDLKDRQSDDNPFSVKLSVEDDKESFNVGDKISFVITADKDCFVYLIDEGTTGAVRLIFPNKWNKSPKVSEGEEVRIPKANSKFHFTVKGDAGTEKVWLVAASEPIEALESLVEVSESDDEPEAKSPFKKMKNPKRVMKDVVAEVDGMDSGQWSVAKVEFEILEEGATTEKPEEDE
ncbi:DUF4384 domain-containing protein [Thermodesulfobacteriota bacterium]